MSQLFELDVSLTEERRVPVDAGDVDFIPTERIHGLRALMNETDGPVTVYIRHKAAIYLTEWGYADGVEYIATEVRKSVEDRVGAFDHRLRGYDITLELFMRALMGYRVRKCSQGEKDETARRLIRPIVKAIIEIACEESFEIRDVFYAEVGDDYEEWYDERLIDDPAVFQRYLIAMLDQKDDRRQGYKPQDAVKFFERYDPEFLKQELLSRGLTKEDV
ncbi:MAG: hypothetical protein ABJG15_06065 [Hyphomonadaceae bacterium]